MAGKNTNKSATKKTQKKTSEKITPPTKTNVKPNVTPPSTTINPTSVPPSDWNKMNYVNHEHIEHIDRVTGDTNDAYVANKRGNNGVNKTVQNVHNSSPTAAMNTSNIIGQANEILYQPPAAQGSQYYPMSNDMVHNYPSSTNNPVQQVGNMIRHGHGYGMTQNQSINPNCNQTMHNIPGGQDKEDSTPQWAAQMMTHLDINLQTIQIQLDSQNKNWQRVEQVLQSQNSKIIQIDSQIQEMKTEENQLNQSLKHVQNTVTNMVKTNMENQEKIDEYGNSIQTYSDMCDEIITNDQDKLKEIHTLVVDVDALRKEVNELKQKECEQNETILDTQTRNMKQNLLFMGIEEIDEIETYKHENVEHIIHEFLRNQMKISKPIDFHVVHRIGLRKRFQTYPRPIVAKFVYLKDRDLVKFSGKELKGTHYSVNEQFPKEIVQRRKSLYPVMRNAKRNPDNKVKLVKDKLYINDQLYSPTERQNIKSNNDTKRYEQDDRFNRDNFNKGRIFYQSRKLERNQGQYANFTTPNRYSVFSETDTTQDRWTHSRIQRGKKKATSPLDTYIQTKKHKEDDKLELETDSMCSEKSVIEVTENEENNVCAANGKSENTMCINLGSNTNETSENSEIEVIINEAKKVCEIQEEHDLSKIEECGTSGNEDNDLTVTLSESVTAEDCSMVDKINDPEGNTVLDNSQ